jgi:hypothetical protein
LASTRETVEAHQDGKDSPDAMIDIYAETRTFVGSRRLAVDLATAVMTIEQVPDIAVAALIP